MAQDTINMLMEVQINVISESPNRCGSSCKFLDTHQWFCNLFLKKPSIHGIRCEECLNMGKNKQ